MEWYSVLAIYLLFWTVTLFVVLPWGIRTGEEAGDEPVPGQEIGAPHKPSMWKRVLWTTVVSTIFFGLFYANWIFGWIDRADLERMYEWIYGI